MDVIAAVDAATGTEINATVRLSARGTAIRGSYVRITSGNDLILGRVQDVAMTNSVHADEKFAPTIMKQGSIPHWSEDVDIERAIVKIIAVQDTETGKRIPLRRNPPSGTQIQTADQVTIDSFTNETKHFLVLGHIPNSGGLLASVVNRHFAEMADKDGRDLGGYGEARHSAILGQSGSAKTVLLTALIAGKLAAHPQMGLLMPDTSGDLCKKGKHSRGTFRWDYMEVLQAAGICPEVIRITDVRLTSPNTLVFKLTPFFKEHLNTNMEKARVMATRVVDEIFKGDDVDATKLTSALIQEQMIALVPIVWDKKSQNDKLTAARSVSPRAFEGDLDRIRKLFDGRWPLDDLIYGVLARSRKVVLDFGGIMASDHRFIMRELMEKLTKKAQIMFHQDRPANALTVLDEAQRWVPQFSDSNNEGIADLVVDGFQTTRKCGCGWIVVTQSPSAIDNDVLRQCHTVYCGRNLGVGVDSKHIENFLGKEGIQAYDQLSVQGDYFWVAAGLDANLGGGRTWFAIHPFDGDATSAFVSANKHIFQHRDNMPVAAE